MLTLEPFVKNLKEYIYWWLFIKKITLNRDQKNLHVWKLQRLVRLKCVHSEESLLRTAKNRLKFMNWNDYFIFYKKCFIVYCCCMSRTVNELSLVKMYILKKRNFFSYCRISVGLKWVSGILYIKLLWFWIWFVWFLLLSTALLWKTH